MEKKRRNRAKARPASGVISPDRCPAREGRAVTCIGSGTQVRGPVDLWTRAHGPGPPLVASRARTPVPGPVRQCRDTNILKFIFNPSIIKGIEIKGTYNRKLSDRPKPLIIRTGINRGNY